MMYVVYIEDSGYDHNTMTWIVETEKTPDELKRVIENELNDNEYDDHYVHAIKPLNEVVKRY